MNISLTKLHVSVFVKADFWMMLDIMQAFLILLCIQNGLLGHWNSKKTNQAGNHLAFHLPLTFHGPLGLILVV